MAAKIRFIGPGAHCVVFGHHWPEGLWVEDHQLPAHQVATLAQNPTFVVEGFETSIGAADQEGPGGIDAETHGQALQTIAEHVETIEDLRQDLANAQALLAEREAAIAELEGQVADLTRPAEPKAGKAKAAAADAGTEA